MAKRSKKMRVIALLTAVTSAFTFASCELFEYLGTGGEESSETSSVSTGETTGETSESESSVSSEETPAPSLTPQEPDAEKELLKTETDTLGHKIAYYTDGTREDLGRVIPLDFTSPTPATQYGYTYFSALTNGDGLCGFYEDLYDAATAFHYSEEDLTADYQVKSLHFSKYDISKNQAMSVWKIFVMENPAFFWIDDAVSISDSTLFLLVDEAYALSTTRKAAQSAIETMATECDAYLNGLMSEAERALNIHDYLALKMDYAYKADGVTPETEIWAHNLVGAALKGKGVCEAYAKAYDYLCTLFGFSALTVTGNALNDGGLFGHAWNAVEIDGVWYSIDVTWDDMGEKSLYRKWFGMPQTSFSSMHLATTPEEGWGISYQYALPALSENGLSPVVYGEADAQLLFAANVEEAFAGMTNTEGHYQIALYPQTAASLALGGEIGEFGAVLQATATPAVASLAILGSYQALAGGYYELAELELKNGLTLACNLIISDLRLTGEALCLQGYTLTTKGNAVALEIAQIRSDLSGTVRDETTEWTALSAVQAVNLTAAGTELRLTDGGNIPQAKIESGMLRFYGTSSVTVDVLIFGACAERLYIDGASNATRIQIGQIQSEKTGWADYVTFFVVYTSAADYPFIGVDIPATVPLNLSLYGSVSPTQLGTSLIRLGADFPYSKLQLTYSGGGVSKYSFEKNEDGDVLYKS